MLGHYGRSFFLALETPISRLVHALRPEPAPQGAAAVAAWGFTGASHALPDLAAELRAAGAREIFSSVELIQAALKA